MAAILAVVVSGVLAPLEWRRPDRRHLATRIGASVLAVFALALLGLHPAWRSPRAKSGSGNGMVAALWTPGEAGPAADQSIAYLAALPGATAAPAGSTVFPDAATLRRRFPQIATLDVFGSGLPPGELDALRGLRVVFHPPARGPASRPSIRFLRCPRTLALGEPLVVEGELGGVPPGETAGLTLAAPNGTDVQSVTTPADADGRADFSLRAAAPTAPGRFLWRVRLMAASGAGGGEIESESLGVAVVPPTLPRVLALESSPHFDTADLRRWFARAGGQFVARTQVGQGRYRFASSSGNAAPEFSVVDARLLAGVDLLLVDAASLAALTPTEREAVLAAVTDTGLGVLALGDETPPLAPPDAALFPWRLGSVADAPQDDGEQLARPSWPGQTQPIATPIPVAPLLLAPLAGASELMRDGQGRTLAAALPRGRGQVGLTLLRDSGRWLRGGDSAAFSAYWSHLFSRLARPWGDGAGEGRWTLAGGDGGPVFAGQPLTLLWSGAASTEASARVLADSRAPEDNAVLALMPDPAESSRWRGTLWPRHAGWYTVFAPAGGTGASLDFFVDDVASWPALRAERCRAATANFAEASGAATQAGSLGAASKGNAAIPGGCLFGLFVASAGFLWAERRLSF